jgi:integrase
MSPLIARGTVPTRTRVELSFATDFAADLARLLHLDRLTAARFRRVGRHHLDAVAPSTLLALRTDVRRWAAWCASAGCPHMPADAHDVAAFVAARAERWRPATLGRVLASLTRVHRLLGLPDPTKDEEVRAAYRAAVRRRAAAGQGGQRQAAGLTEGAVRAMLAGLGGRLIDCRDRALLLAARDLLARRGELAALCVADVMPTADGGATVRLGRSKTDRAGQGSYQYLGPRAYAALRTWLRAARITHGPIFRSVHVTGRVGTGLHAGSVSAVLKKLAWRVGPALQRQGIDPHQVSGHSCRVGMAQDLAASGFDVVAIMQAGRWTSPGMVARYVERLHVTRGAVAQYYQREAAHHSEYGTLRRVGR